MATIKKESPGIEIADDAVSIMKREDSIKLSKKAVKKSKNKKSKSKSKKVEENFFKHENASVDLFLKEISSSDLQLDTDKIKTEPEKISPTKPLNFKNVNSSSTSLNFDSEEKGIGENNNSEKESSNFLQDIPAIPTSIGLEPEYPSSNVGIDDNIIIRSNSQVKGPRELIAKEPIKSVSPKKIQDKHVSILRTPNGKNKNIQELAADNSPSRKSVVIDSSPPKICEYEQQSSEDESNASLVEENIYDLNQSEELKWKALPLKKHYKPLPPINKTSADSSFVGTPLGNALSPDKRSIADIDSDTSSECSRVNDLDITTEEVALLSKKLTLEEKLNAVLDNCKNDLDLDYDHDRYLEDQKIKKTLRKKRSFYEDILLNDEKRVSLNQEQAYSDLSNLYVTNVRNTDSNHSLKLSLERSNSIASQASILSNERILFTNSDMGLVGAPIIMKDGVKGFDDQIVEELIREPVVFGQDVVEDRFGSLKTTDDSDDFISAEKSIIELLDTNIRKNEQKDVITEESLAKTHQKKSSTTEALSPSEVGQLLTDNFKEIISPKDVSNVESPDAVNIVKSENLNVAGDSLYQNEVSSIYNDTKSASLKLDSDKEADNDSDQKQVKISIMNEDMNTEKSAEIAQETEENEGLKNLDSNDILDSQEDDILEKDKFGTNPSLPASNQEQQEILGNSTEADIAEEFEEDKVGTAIDSNSDSSFAEISKTEFELPYPQFEEDPHYLDLSDESTLSNNSTNSYSKRKISSPASNTNTETTPQFEVLSIWQSQPEYQHIPKHQTTRCGVNVTSMTPKADNLAKRNISPKQVNLLGQRVISYTRNNGFFPMGGSGFANSSSRKNSEYVEKSEVQGLGITGDDGLTNTFQYIELEDTSADSDFGDDFKEYGIKVDPADKDEFYNSQDMFPSELSPSVLNRAVKNIWRSGTIRSVRSVHEHKNSSSSSDTVNIRTNEDYTFKNVHSTVEVQNTGAHPQQQAAVEVASFSANNYKDDGDVESTVTVLRNIDEEGFESVSNHTASPNFERIKEKDLTEDKLLGTEIKSPAHKDLEDYNGKHHYAELTKTRNDYNKLQPLHVSSKSRINSLGNQEKKAFPEFRTKPKLINGESGRLFVNIKSLKKIDLPDVKSHDAKFCIILDNGIHRIKTEYFSLGQNVPIDKEFELIVGAKLSFVLTLKSKYSKPKDQLVEVKEKEVVRSKSFFGRLFGSKQVITRTKFVTRAAEKDSWDSVMANDGSFAKCRIDFSDFEHRITGEANVFDIPLINEWRDQNKFNAFKIGTLQLGMLFIPRTSQYEILPTSIKSAYEQVEELRKQMSVYHEGYLFQEGGDCAYFKRRFFKLQGSTFIAHNDVTLKTRARINLTKVVDLIYLGKEEQGEIIKKNPKEKILKNSNSRNISDSLLLNEGFRMKFANGEIIDFGAQNQIERLEWIKVLEEVINRNHFARQPWVKTLSSKMNL
ncbi:hypothetical protein PACTADRAFT_51634 [Pachysolen tannophilus NRRL Y-2460]|uniref:PH domain-containing protein n=1 Tax=Pachysolen tannophilus NRRL Y-2460 TaxID=669874 RepID=A0A1E4TQ62_PACTA|nr:hypothetical protein PACTADRAFT_51634 [Pachysolen tannophilus NRRL Y-2460]